MGSVEDLERYFNDEEISDPRNVKDKLENIKQDIAREWQSFKSSMTILSDAEIKDDKLDMLLMYLIKQGFFT